MLRVAHQSRTFATAATRRSAFADFPLPKDMPTQAPTPLTATFQLKSGLRVGAYDTHGPVSSLALAVPAGARYETASNLGAAHHLANYAFHYTENMTPLKIAREAELRGVQFQARADRECLVYEAQFLRDDLPFVMEILSDVVYRTKYNHWEFNPVAQHTKEQAATERKLASFVSNEVTHRLMFRQGLGNSPLAPIYQSISNDVVKAFAEANLSISDRSGLYATGVHPEELKKYSELFFVESKGSVQSSPKSSYHSCQSRVDVANGGNNVTVAFPGAAAGTKEAATLSVVAALLGGESHVKWTPGSSPLAKVACEATAAVHAKHVAYTDAGLFTLSATCRTSPVNASKGIRGAVRSLKEVADKLEANDLVRAINQAKAASLNVLDSKATQAVAGAKQLALSGKVESSKHIITSLSEVKSADVKEAVQRLLKAKPVVVASGRTSELAYADELGF